MRSRAITDREKRPTDLLSRGTTPKRGPGRPPLSEGGAVQIRVLVPVELHAELIAEAERRGVPLAEVVRERLSLTAARARLVGVLRARMT